MSAWGTALPVADVAEVLGSAVALLAAIGVGGWVGAWISARKDLEQQEREIEQQMRGRMLQAADDFVGAASAALSELRALDPTVQKQRLGAQARLMLGEVKVDRVLTAGGLTPELLGQVKVSLDQASRQLTRIGLIFGPTSPAATEGGRAVTRMLEAWATLQWYYAVARASESAAVVTRRDLIVGVVERLGEAGLERVWSAAPDLAGSVGNLGGRVIGSAITNVQKPLDEASTGAMAAVEAASDALDAFTADARHQALEALQPWHHVIYRVDSRERVVQEGRPKRRRFLPPFKRSAGRLR